MESHHLLLISFHSDQAIEGDANSPDRLNRKEYAERLGSALLLSPNSPGIVLSIEGPWGYGKSSLINLIHGNFNSIQPKERPIMLSFNPWMIGSTESLIQAFLVQFASAISIKNTNKKITAAAKELLSYSTVFSALKFVPGAEPGGAAGPAGPASAEIASGA